MKDPVEGIDYAILTEADVALLEMAATQGVQYLDYSEFQLEDDE